MGTRTKGKPKTGRPSDFTPDIANEICERLSKGESLRKICEDDDFLPSARTVHRWLATEEEWAISFRQQYARAREAQADFYAEQVVEIADCADRWLGVERDPQRDRLRIDARKWYAGKLAPKKYGDKIAHVGGDEGDAPIKHNVAVEFV